jgi:hypothetical protein
LLDALTPVFMGSVVDAELADGHTPVRVLCLLVDYRIERI